MKTEPRSPTIVVTVLLLIAWSAASPDGSAQSITVTGTVLYSPELSECFKEVPCTDAVELTDEEDWIPPKAAVNIAVKGTDAVVKTDRAGKYEMAVPSEDDTLLFMYIGHNRLEIPVDGRTVVDVRLTPTPLPVIDRILGTIMPEIVAGNRPDIDELAAEAGTNRATMRDFLWLVLGNQPFSEAYPNAYVPDYRFEENWTP